MFPIKTHSVPLGQVAQSASVMLQMGLIIFVMASITQLIAYRSVEPILVAIGFILIGRVIFWERSPLGGRSECFAFMLIFLSGFFWSGVTAIFTNLLNDPIAHSDAAWFYKLAIGSHKKFDFSEMRAITSGGAHIYIWQFLYSSLSAVGFQKGIYVGTAFNTFLVAITGVIGVKTAAFIFIDEIRIKHRLTIIVALCGTFWLFASVMIRDSSVLLLNSLLIYVWVRLLVRQDWTSFAITIAIGAIAQVLYLNLRPELMLVPAALTLAALFSLILLKKLSPISEFCNKKIVVKLLLCLLSSALVQLMVFAETGFSLRDATKSSAAQYIIHATTNNTAPEITPREAVDTSSLSLGLKYLINQPFLIRAAIGSYYVNVFPIPFWSGLVSGEIYQIFKSINVIFMWFIVPLALIGLYETIRQDPLRQKLGSIFLAVVYLGFTVGVGATSLESRHLASFFIPLLILAAIPNFDFQPTKVRFLKIFGGWAILIMLTHLAWYSLKQMQLGSS